MVGGFIQLNRTFHPLSDKAENDDADIRRFIGIGKPLGWSNLLKLRRVVILSEAGSGKTFEIRQIARQLRADKRPAFFLRLEHLGEHFESAFEEGSSDEFNAWLSSVDDGWLLLDSIDEARLRDPLDFAKAIRILGHRLGAAKQRAHIVLSGRSTAWRPNSDLALCVQHLPYVEPKEPPRSTDEIEQDKTAKEKPPFKVVALDDLNSKQIEIFAKAKGVIDAKSLLEAVERADAWSFTARPQDLEELVAFWTDRGRIGSQLELMTNSIQRRLAERSQERAEARPLSPARTRVGARLVAAASTLARESTVRIPDGHSSDKGLSIRSILPDWTDIECITLLSRPIFDEAIYGTVRFHHRTVREYLTAEWCAELLGQQTSRKRVEELFFRWQYGVEVVVPSMRQVLAWLILLDEGVRERAQRVAPEVFFEGGDPSQLPLATRRRILRRVCEQLAAGTSTRSVQNHSAIQRFAAEDLTNDVIELIEVYRDNKDLLWFLLRMVWQGQIGGALPQAKAVALTPSAEKYVRRAAFRAVAATGSPSDLAEVRESFSNEASPLDREWIAELLSHTDPTVGANDWLFQCIDKAKAPKRDSADSLIAETTRFVERMPRSSQMAFVRAANERLERPPVVEQRHCEISRANAWLLRPAGTAVHRLIEARDEAALDAACLAILHKLPVGEQYERIDFGDTEFQFRKLIQGWPELRFSLFWHLIAHERLHLGKEKGERLTEWWNYSIFDSYVGPFNADDFASALTAIGERDFLDDKLVALTLAFDLYKSNGRPAEWRRSLKRAVAIDTQLKARLASLMKPPAESASTRKARLKHVNWQRQHKARKAIETENYEKWRASVRAKPESIRAPKLSKSDDVSRWQWLLYEKLREKQSDTSNVSVGDWQKLEGEFGGEVARAFRDGAVEYWRRHSPKLLSEGSDIGSWRVPSVFGLTGLAIESREVAGWPSGLTEAEAKLAFRYAMEEFNGFPHWMPKLFNVFPTLILGMMLIEIDYELSVEKPDEDSHYLLADLSWSGEWAWDAIAPELLKRLVACEPKNLRNLAHMLKVINQASTVSDTDIAQLAAARCELIANDERLASWYATWVGVLPAEAIPQLEAHLISIESSERQTMFAMEFVSQLMGARSNRATSHVRERFCDPASLKRLYLLMHRYVRRSEDIERAGTGVYSPELRDDAQDGRDRLFTSLTEITGKGAYLAMIELAEEFPDLEIRPRFLFRAKSKAEADSEGVAWTAEQVHEFTCKLERTPTTHRDLFDLAVMRLEDLKTDLEDGDSSNAEILRGVSDEVQVRKFIGGWCRAHANGRYSIPQEEELADAKRIDMRFHGAGVDAPVPCELKLADNWTGPALMERLETQLCGDYLRDVRSARGLFVLVYRGEKRTWELSEGAVDFSALVGALQAHWMNISTRFPSIEEICVVGIDLTKRVRTT